MEVLKKVALFQFIPSKWFTDYLKSLVVREDQIVLDGEDFLDSTGSLLVIGLALGLVAGIALIATLLCKQSPQCHKILTFVKQKLFWNSFIRYSLQSYIKIAFAHVAVSEVLLVLPM